MRTHAVVAGLACAIACGNDATEPMRPGINIVSGASVSDTIDARLPVPLRVRVVDESGKPLARTEVQFSGAQTFVPRLNAVYTSALVQRDDQAAPSARAVDTTDALGNAGIRVILGHFAASAGVVVTVPTHAFADSVPYTVLPGAPAATSIAPHDTAVTVGGTFDVVTGIADRGGDPLPGTAVLTVSGGSIAVTPGGKVSTSAPVRAAIVASSGSARRDTAWVSIVPRGTMAAAVSGQLSVMELDGRERRIIPTALGASDPEWSVDGSALLAQLAPNSIGGSLYRVDLSANAVVAIEAGPPFVGGGAWVTAPIWGFAPASDGSIFLSAGGCNYMAILYRSPPGSTSTATRISPPATGDDCFDTVHHFPSPSPDGSRVVFEHRTSYFTGSNIRLMDVGTGSITTLGVNGQRPRWSPRGDLIAFTEQGRIWIMAPDGSGRRAVSPAAHAYLLGVSWSSDGKWLLARFASPLGNENIVSVLEVATGMELPLMYTRSAYLNNFGVPVWRPGT